MNTAKPSNQALALTALIGAMFRWTGRDELDAEVVDWARNVVESATRCDQEPIAAEINAGIKALIQHCEGLAAQPAVDRKKLAGDAKRMQHCAIAVSDWLAGGCDTHSIPRPEIAVLVAWTKQSTAEAAAIEEF